MANGKAWFGRTFGKYLFDHTRIAEVTAIGERFRRLDLVGDVVGTTSWSPGDKVQVFVGDGGMRTYTPFDWDVATNAVSLLVFVRDESPGSCFGRDAKVGDAVDYFGPRGSIALDSLREPVLLFGDETSFALARSLRLRHPGARAVLEVDSVDEATEVARAIGIEGISFVAKSPGGAHLASIAATLASQLRETPGASLVWSGRAKSIQSLRKQLAASSVSPRKNLAKAYWADGRTGLD